MDLLALGTPVVDLFAKVSERDLACLGFRKGATNYFSAREISSIERRLGRRIRHKYPGDNARNVCEGFAALSGFCGFAGAIGTDKAGAQFSSNLTECGIAAFLQERKGSTGKIIALVTPGGQRTFCADLGVSGQCTLFESIAAKNSRMLYLTSITLCVDAPVAKLALKYMDLFKKAKKPIAIALENPPMVEKNRKRLMSIVKRYASVLFLNEEEAFAFLESAPEKKLGKLKPKIPIYLKKGGKGSILFFKGRHRMIKARKARVLDTTGAGDAYAAGTLYGLTRGYTPFSSGKIGCYLATKVVEKFGAGVPLKHTRLALKHKR